VSKRGRPCRLTVAEQHELRRYREAGVSIARLASMWHVCPATVHNILADQRAKFGPEKLPDHIRHRARVHLYRSNNSDPSATGN